MLTGQRAIRNAHSVKSSYLGDEEDADRSQAAQQDIEHVSMLRAAWQARQWMAGQRAAWHVIEQLAKRQASEVLTK
jgi:hypothetical protein